MSTREEIEEEENKDEYSPEYNKQLEDSGIRSPYSVQEILQPQQQQQNPTLHGEPSSSFSHFGGKQHSSKKPPSHGSTWFGLLPSWTKLFGTKQHSEATLQPHHKSSRRHSEPSNQVSCKDYSVLGKSTSYPEQLPPADAGTKEDDSKATRQHEAVSESTKENMDRQETVIDMSTMPTCATSAKVCNDGVPTVSSKSDAIFSSKSKTKGLSASVSIDEFLNKIAQPRRHSVTGRRHSFHSTDVLSSSSSESTPPSSHSRSRSSSLVGSLLHKSHTKDSKLIVPVTGARQLRPHEISRHKYLECLKKKLVPTEFVYTKPAEQVLLMGDWLEWDSIPLEWDQEKGLFRVVVDLPVGDHEFRYIVTPKQDNPDDRISNQLKEPDFNS
jgi:hypothetical protein